MALFGRWAEGSQSPVPRFPEIRICGSSKWEVQSVCLWSDEGTPRRWRQLRPAGSPVPRRAYLVADGSCLLAACTYVPACRSPATVSIHTTHITRWHVVYSMFKGHGDGTPGEREKNTAWFDPSTILHMNYVLSTSILPGLVCLRVHDYTSGVCNPQIRQNTSDPRGSETPDEDRRFLRRRQGMAGHNEK